MVYVLSRYEPPIPSSGTYRERNAKKRVNPFCSASTGIQSVLAFSRSAAVNIAIQRISLASLYACKASLSANASADSGSVLSLLNEKVLMDSPYGNGESTLRFLRV